MRMQLKIRSVFSQDWLLALILGLGMASMSSAMPSGYPEGMYISGPDSISGGESAQYGCVLTYSSGEEYPVDGEGYENWQIVSGPASILSSGLMTADEVSADSSCQIYLEYVTDSGAFFTAEKTVAISSSPPQEIVITGADSIGEGLSQSYVATLITEGEDDVVVTETASWDVTGVSGCSIALGVLQAGMVTEDSICTVRVTYNGIEGVKSVTVLDHPVVVSGLELEGTNEVDESSLAVYSCWALYSVEGVGPSNVTDQVAWSVEGSESATVEQGLLTVGEVSSNTTVRITAMLDGQTATIDVQIRNILPQSLTIVGPDEVDEGVVGTFDCTAFYANGTERTVTALADWSCNQTGASIAEGVYTPLAVTSDMSYVISAQFEGCAADKQVTVRNIPLNALVPQSFEDGLGAWINISSNSYIWNTNSGETPTSGTGPGAASDQSVYLYTEASGNEGNVAIIESPVFSLEEIAVPILKFDYHMYGVGMGDLFVDLYTDDWNEAVWRSDRDGEMHFESSQPWNSGEINLSAYKSMPQLKVRFRGVVGANFLSDMALDHVRLVDLAYSQPTTYDEWIAINGLSGDDADIQAAPRGDSIPNIIKYATGLDGNEGAASEFLSITNANEFLFSKDMNAGDVELVPVWAYDLHGFWSEMGINQEAVGVEGDRELIKAVVPSGDRGFFKLRVRSSSAE